MIIVTEGLLMFYGEEKRENMEDQALNDAIRKFHHGLSPLFYGSIPYLPCKRVGKQSHAFGCPANYMSACL